MIRTELWEIESRGSFDIVILTERVKDFIRMSGYQEGFITLFFRHTTGSIIVAEYEVGILVDIKDALENVIAEDHLYKHHLRGVDNNGQAHVWSVLLSHNASVMVPFSKGAIVLGKYQDVIMVDMQTGSKPREIFVQLITME